MAVLAHFALPITLSTPILRRFPLSPPLMFSSSLQFTPRRIFLRQENHRRRFARSMGTDESQEAVAPTSVPVRVAHELLQAGHRYLDVRMVDEFNAGHVVGATNIPFMFKPLIAHDWRAAIASTWIARLKRVRPAEIIHSTPSHFFSFPTSSRLGLKRRGGSSFQARSAASFGKKKVGEASALNDHLEDCSVEGWRGEIQGLFVTPCDHSGFGCIISALPTLRFLLDICCKCRNACCNHV